MEYIIVVFLGLWLIGASYLAYFRLKKEFEEIERNEDKE